MLLVQKMKVVSHLRHCQGGVRQWSAPTSCWPTTPPTPHHVTNPDAPNPLSFTLSFPRCQAGSLSQAPAQVIEFLDTGLSWGRPSTAPGGRLLRRRRQESLGTRTHGPPPSLPPSPASPSLLSLVSGNGPSRLIAFTGKATPFLSPPSPLTGFLAPANLSSCSRSLFSLSLPPRVIYSFFCKNKSMPDRFQFVRFGQNIITLFLFGFLFIFL